MFNPDRINIHELTIEEPEKQSELPFDPDKEITDDDWGKMKDALERSIKYYYNAEENWKKMRGNVKGEIGSIGDYKEQSQSFSYDARKLKVLFPDRDLGLDNKDWKEIMKDLKELRQYGNWQTFASKAVAIKTLDSSKKLGLDKFAWKGIKDAYQEVRKKNSEWFPADFAVEIKTLDPSQDLDLDQTAWQSMKNKLEDHRKLSSELSSHGHLSWGSFASLAADMKILDPTVDLNLDEAAWKGMRATLEKYKLPMNGVSDYHLVSTLAADMKILAAEEVKVTDKGLEITMRKPKLESNVPPISETKKF